MVELIRSDPNKMQEFKTHKKKDYEYAKEYNQERINLRNDIESLRSKEKYIN
jgi:hypothetical protein